MSAFCSVCGAEEWEPTTDSEIWITILRRLISSALSTARRTSFKDRQLQTSSFCVYSCRWRQSTLLMLLLGKLICWRPPRTEVRNVVKAMIPPWWHALSFMENTNTNANDGVFPSRKNTRDDVSEQRSVWHRRTKQAGAADLRTGRRPHVWTGTADHWRVSPPTDVQMCVICFLFIKGWKLMPMRTSGKRGGIACGVDFTLKKTFWSQQQGQCAQGWSSPLNAMSTSKTEHRSLKHLTRAGRRILAPLYAFDY